MAYDGIMMHRVIDVCQKEMVGGRVNKIYQISKYELLFQVRANRKNIKFLLSCHPMYARMQLTNLQYPTPEQPNTLTMLFRKHLEGAYIKSMEQIGLDRICHILFSTHNDLGDYIEYHCYIEIMGKHSNVILTNPDNKIIDCLKRITPNMNSTRFLQPGAMYQFPPINMDKKNPFTDGFIPSDNLTTIYQGVSPILSKEVLYRLDQNYNYNDIMQEIKTSSSLYLSKVDTKEYFHLLPLTHLQVDYTEYSLFDGLDAHFHLIDQKDRIKQQTSNLLKYVQNEYHKNTTKLHKLEKTLFDSTNSDEYRIKGDLLFSNLHVMKKGMHHVTLDNYYDNTEITIDLDPRLNPKQNAKKYYTKYQKAKNSITVLEEQINLTKKEIEYFDGLITLLGNANYYDALEIKEELENLGYLKKRITKGKKVTKKPKFEIYTTKDNIEICIGKNNLQNEYLTFKHANRYDTWFHVKDMPGSHIVVKGDTLDEYTIRLASNLAAYYSKGKDSSSVPVNYTLVKNLKKIPGGKPGQVILDTYKTIYIDPDASYLDEITKK
ncbi:MAG: NFACT family protein [Coprobacillaceae bacterium]